MELFAAIIFSCSIVSRVFPVPSASDQADIVKKMETFQEGINTVSEKLVTQSLLASYHHKAVERL